MAELTMPALGADMTHGKLLEWRVKPGDEVHRGDIVAVIDTDKAEIEIGSFHDGVVSELVVPEGERVQVGATIARLNGQAPAGAGAPAPPAAAPAPVPLAPPAPPARAAPAPAAAPPARVAGRLRVSPLARRAARTLGVDVEGLAGTGPGGSIVRADVERAAAGPAAPPPVVAAPAVTPAPAGTARPAAGGAERIAAMRRATAALMARSKREVPHFHLQSTLDFSRAAARLEALNAQRPAPRRVLPAALLLQAVAGALRATPELNGHWIDDELRPSERVHLGVAIALRGGGLVAPAIHDADRLDLDGLMEALRDLIARVRAGRLRAAEMTDGTLTVTQLGERGADTVQGVIHVPQVALVGFGRIAERPWAENGMVGARPTVVVTLAADHRASDGHAGSRLLDAIDRRLQEES